MSQLKGRDVQAEGGTAAEQEKRCRAQLEADGLTVGLVFVDLDQSGKLESRPAFDQAMERALTGVSGGIITRNLKRFGRRLSVVRDILALEEAGAIYLSCEEKIDTTTPSGRMVLTVLAAIATMELETLTEGLNDSRQRGVANGVHAGIVPAGYERSVTGHKSNGNPIHGPLVPNEYAPLIREAFEMRARGRSLREIGDFLREREVPNNARRWKSGSIWSHAGVRAMLSNETYLGTVRNGEFVKENAHEAIVTPALFRAVQRMKGEKQGSRGDKTPALLARIAKCGTCGRSLTRDHVKRPDGRVYETYRCKHAGCARKTSISLPALDQYVTYLTSELHAALIPDRRPDRDEELKRLEDELAAVTEEIEAFAESFIEEGVSPAVAAKMIAQLEAKKAEIEQQVEAVEVEAMPIEIPEHLRHEMRVTPKGLAIQGGAFFDILRDDPGANAFLRRVIDSVVVMPGRGDIHNRAEVNFKV